MSSRNRWILWSSPAIFHKILWAGKGHLPPYSTKYYGQEEGESGWIVIALENTTTITVTYRELTAYKLVRDHINVSVLTHPHQHNKVLVFTKPITRDRSDEDGVDE